MNRVIITVALFCSVELICGCTTVAPGTLRSATASTLEGAWYCVSNSWDRGSSTLSFLPNGDLLEETHSRGKTANRFLCGWRLDGRVIRLSNRQWYRREEWPLSDCYWPKQTEWQIEELDKGTLIVNVPDFERHLRRQYVRADCLAHHSRTIAEFAGDDGKLRLIWDNTEEPNTASHGTALPRRP